MPSLSPLLKDSRFDYLVSESSTQALETAETTQNVISSPFPEIKSHSRVRELRPGSGSIIRAKSLAAWAGRLVWSQDGTFDVLDIVLDVRTLTLSNFYILFYYKYKFMIQICICHTPGYGYWLTTTAWKNFHKNAPILKNKVILFLRDIWHS